MCRCLALSAATKRPFASIYLLGAMVKSGLYVCMTVYFNLSVSYLTLGIISATLCSSPDLYFPFLQAARIGHSPFS